MARPPMDTSTDHGFDEVWSIDPSVIRNAADELPQAADWMRRKLTTPETAE